MKIKLISIYLYLMLPIAIFFVNWIEWYVGIPVILIIIYGFVCVSKIDLNVIEWTKSDKEKIFLCIFIILFWVYLSGIGAFVFQNNDHTSRNAIFNALVEYPWPVVGQVEIDGVLTNRSLVYYIGFWLPAALIGKVLGLRAGYCAQALWAAIGIFIFYMLICHIRKKVSIWPLMVFIFFSGLDVVGYFVTNTNFDNWTSSLHLEWWAEEFQYSSFTTQLFWVFNQAIPAWIIIALLYVQKNNKYIVFILSLSLLTSTLPFIGMIPFFVYFVLSRTYDEVEGIQDGLKRFTNKAWWKCFFKDTFTFANVCGGGCIGILSFLYLKGNSAGKIVGETISEGNPKGYLLYYLLFVLLEVGVYFIATYKCHYKKPLFYVCLVWLCICPLIRVGTSADFCMRASIPALVILYIMVIQAIDEYREKKLYVECVAIIAILVVGAVTARNEFIRTISTTVYRYNNDIEIIDEPTSFENLLKSQNFSGDADEGIWGKYIRK